jgi:Transposase DDE domain
MNVSHLKKKKNQKLLQRLTDQENELLKMQRKLNKQKKNNRKRARAKKAKLVRIAKKKRTNEPRDQKIQRKLKKEKGKIRRFSGKFTSWLNVEGINKIAIITGYIKRIDLKILPLPFLLTLAYGMYGDGASTLTQLAMNMKDWFNISITAQALSDRMSKIESVNFLKQILFQAMTQQITNGFKNKYAEIFSKFTSVQLEDSTQFKLHEQVSEGFRGCGGSGSISAMKLNTVYNITEHTVSGLDIAPGAVPDQALSKNVAKKIKKGALWIRDLGYFSIFDMSVIVKLKAFFLSRLKKGVNVFLNEKDKNPVLIDVFLKENTENGMSFDKDIYIGEGDLRIKVRIVGEKVPEEVRQKRIERHKKNVIKRDKKKKMSEDYVDWFGYSVFITNVSREMLASAAIIMTIYKIRWQIELFFKRIKSLLQINIIKGETDNRVYCLIYAKLISLLMSQSITSYAAHICEEEEISEYKLMQWLQLNNRLGNALINGDMETLLEKLIEVFYLLCKNKRRKNKSTFRRIEEVFEASLIERNELETAA